MISVISVAKNFDPPRRGGGWGARAWRYGPVVVWIAVILYASTGAMAASNTSRIIGPLLRWLFPDITEGALLAAHMFVRKCAHFGVYALLALLAARAFLGSAREFLRRRWIAASLALVAAVALTDEYNQSFQPTRTGTIWDSLLDCAGGATALAALAWLRRRRRAHTAKPPRR